MSIEGEETHGQLVERLTNGFGALLEQVQELASKNQDLEHRLARVQEEVYHIFRDEGPLAALEESTGLNSKMNGFYGGITDGRVSPPSPQIGVRNSSDMDDEDQACARAIANGVRAWKKLTQRKIPVAAQRTTQSTDRRWVLPREFESKPDSKEDVKESANSPIQNMAAKGSSGCPFSKPSSNLPPSHPSIQRPGSLPTPPEQQEDPLKEAISPPAKPQPSSSPPPSVTGSSSKCPIRFLDHYSPEEVAEYFKNHKHEIPRSHEVCVKRYQSNAESIRQLDSKYGNLVSMIQGLGVKHQPLLPVTEREQNDPPTQRKIQRWANDVGDIPASQAVAGTGANAEGDAQADMEEKGEEDEREGRFQRSLKDIRVGESPSRPWGISMPLAANMHPAMVDALKGLVGGKDAGHDGGKGEKTEIAPSMAPLPDVGPSSHPAVHFLAGDGKGMVFTGPVFIGYSEEQTSALLSRLRQEAYVPAE